MHAMDPRGGKIGGIETHMRLILRLHPPTTTVLFIGVDEIGDLRLGMVHAVPVETRVIDFFPIARMSSSAINTAATAIGRSLTLQFAIGLLRYNGAIRRAAAGLPATCEIERFEFAAPAKLLGLPLVVFAHNEGTRDDAMDSLLKRYWWVHRASEWIALRLADRIFAVNPSIAARVGRLSASLARKTAVMAVPVDLHRFATRPFEQNDGALRIVHAGRLDAFKDPRLMLSTLARLADNLEGTGFDRLEFHYIGASDPARFMAPAAVAPITIHHGVRASRDVAAIMARCHLGLITSIFEGMPCYLLEMIATGRPVVAVTLPQFSSVIVSGVSGALVERQETSGATADRLAEAIRMVARDIDARVLVPQVISAFARPFSSETHLTRLFACHAALADRP